MPFQLDKPISVGDLVNQISVSRLEVAAISINLQKGHVAQGNGVISIVLEDPDSGWQQTFTYRDASVLEFIGGLKGELTALLAPIWQKLQDDGKLPAGSVEVKVPQESAIDAAVAAKAAQLEAAPALLAVPADQIKQ